MKKFLLFSIACLAACFIIINRAGAQKTGGDKVTVQITRDGKVVSDTTFQLKEGQDPEAVKKIIGHVLGGDIQVISEDKGHEKMIWVTTEDDEHAEHAEDLDVSFDSVSKHEEMVMIHKGDHPGEIHKKVIVKEGPGGKESEETIIIGGDEELEITEEAGEEEGSKIIIIKEKSDQDAGTHQKTIKVIVEDDKDMDMLDNEDLEEFDKNNSDSTEVYIIKDKDGTKIIKKVKKVEVSVEVEDEDNDNAEEPPAEPAPKPEKKKK